MVAASGACTLRFAKTESRRPGTRSCELRVLAASFSACLRASCAAFAATSSARWLIR
jgi:hypothetical protein